MISNLILDLLVAGLLVATLYYCFRLDRRLRTFRSGQDGLHAVVNRLDAATETARRTIEELKSIAGVAGEQLEKRARGAQALVDELKLIVESGENLAARLDTRLAGIGRATPSSEPSVKAGQEETNGTVTALPRMVVAREERILRALREAR